MVFGAIAADLHYDVFSRLLAELASKILRILLVCFFDIADPMPVGPKSFGNLYEILPASRHFSQSFKITGVEKDSLPVPGRILPCPGKCHADFRPLDP